MTWVTDYEEKARAFKAEFSRNGGRKPTRKEVPVFDRHPSTAGFKAATTGVVEFRRTDADRAAPKKSMTRKLMGDPMPGRTPWAAE